MFSSLRWVTLVNMEQYFQICQVCHYRVIHWLNKKVHLHFDSGKWRNIAKYDSEFEFADVSSVLLNQSFRSQYSSLVDTEEIWVLAPWMQVVFFRWSKQLSSIIFSRFSLFCTAHSFGTTQMWWCLPSMNIVVIFIAIRYHW